MLRRGDESLARMESVCTKLRQWLCGIARRTRRLLVAGGHDQRQIIDRAGPGEIIIMNVGGARAAEQKTSELNQQDERDGMPQDRSVRSNGAERAA